MKQVETLVSAVVLVATAAIMVAKKVNIVIVNSARSREDYERNLTILNRRFDRLKDDPAYSLWINRARSAVDKYEITGDKYDLQYALRALESAEFFTN